MMQTDTNDNQAIWYCVLSGILIFIGLFVPYSNLLALGLCAYFLYRLNNEDKLCYTFFLVFYAPIFKLNITGFSLFNVVVLLAVGVTLFKTKFKLEAEKGTSFIILLLYSIAGGLSGLTNVLSCMGLILMACLLYSPVGLSLRRVTVFGIWGILSTSAIALFSEKIHPIARLNLIISTARVRLAPGEYYNRFSGVEANPNYYTVFISIAIAVLMVLFIKEKTKKIDFIYFIALTVFGFLSMSQSFVLTYVVTIGLTLIMMHRGANRSNLLAFLGIICALFVVYVLLDDATISTLLFRINSTTSQNNLSSITTGRSSLWLAYLKYLMDNFGALFFGRGLGAGNLSVGASHNYYLDILYHYGIIGGIIYLWTLILIFGTRRYRTERSALYQYIPFAVFLIRAFSRNLIMSEQLVYILLICSISIAEDHVEANNNGLYKQE